MYKSNLYQNMSSRKLQDSVKKIIAHKQKYHCSVCNELLPPSYQVDHIIPHSISNDDSEDNLQALCPNCHSLKTQRENLRIYQYKKLREKCPEDSKLCWFCIEVHEINEEHTCSKQVKNIEKCLQKQKAILTSFEEVCNKYKYTKHDIANTNDREDEGENKCENKEDILKVRIVLNMNENENYGYVYVKDNFVCKIKSDKIYPEDVADCIFIATRTKKDSKKYTSIDISVESNVENDNEEYENEKNECLEYLIDNLENLLPERIFKNMDDITWMV
jgi:hypothetical protein